MIQHTGRGATGRQQAEGGGHDGEMSQHAFPRLRQWIALAVWATLTFDANAVVAQTFAPRAPVASPPAPTAAPVGPRFAVSLAEAVFIGLRNNRTVKSAYITRVAEKFDLFVARTRFRPTAVLAASAEEAFERSGTGSTITVSPTVSWLAPTGAEFQFTWSRFDARSGGQRVATDTTALSVTQPLLRGAGLAVNAAPVKIAELQDKIDRLALKSTVANTVDEIILAYRNLLQAQEQLAIARDSLDGSHAQLQLNQALIDAGRMAAAEIVQTQADIANQEVALLQVEQQRNSAQLALLALLAMDLHTNVVASDVVKADRVDVDLDRAVAMALDNRMDYLAQRRALDQARQNLIVAKNNRLWTLSIVGGVQHQGGVSGGGLVVDPVTRQIVTGVGQQGDSATIGLNLRIPLGDFSLQQQEVQATTAVRVQEVQLADLAQRIEAEVRDAVQQVELSWRQVDAARQAHRLANLNLTLERERLKVGRASNFEVVTFESNLRAAATQELSAVIAYSNALTTLDQQLGTTLDTWKISLND